MAFSLINGRCLLLYGRDVTVFDPRSQDFIGNFPVAKALYIPRCLPGSLYASMTGVTSRETLPLTKLIKELCHYLISRVVANIKHDMSSCKECYLH